MTLQWPRSCDGVAQCHDLAMEEEEVEVEDWRWVPLRWKSKLGTNGTEAPPPHSLIARAQWGPSTAQWGPNTLLPALLPTILNYTKWPLPGRLISFVHIFVVDIAGVALDSDLYHQQTGGLCSHRYEEKLQPLLPWGKDFK